MLIFSGSSNESLAKKIASELGLDISPIEIHVFPDGEKRIRLLESVVGEETVVVQPTAIPTDENYMELYFILDALKRNGAKSITSVVPYVGYQRQDHVFRVGEARSLEAVVKMLEVSGAHKIVGVDFHSIKIPELFKIPVVHLSAIPLFAEKIREIGFNREDSVVVTPDMGGIRRIKELSELLNNVEYTAIEKDRDLATGSVTVAKVHGGVKKTCFIVDDMISSGRTIVNAVNTLLEGGAERVYVFATHPVFSEEAPKILQESRAEKVFVTDSIFVPKEKEFEKLEILSIAPTIAQALK